MNKFLNYLNIFLILFVFGCNNDEVKKPLDSDTIPNKTMDEIIPIFNEDSAYLFIKAQVDFGPRVPNSIAHAKCADYLYNKLKSYTSETQIQQAKVRAYDGTVLNIKNIIATFYPEKTSRILLCAHWDSRPYADQDIDIKNHKKPIDGANDGASGVGVLIEIARLLSQSQPNIGVDIILFDGEDYGQPEFSTIQDIEDSWCLGSQYWAKNPHKQGYQAKFGILLDMVGADNANFTFEAVSMYFAPDVMNKVWNTASDLGYSNYFVKDRTPEITDDHLYINQIIKIPTIDIIQYDPDTRTKFYKHWHTLNDRIEYISKPTLKAVGQTVITVIYKEK